MRPRNNLKEHLALTTSRLKSTVADWASDYEPAHVKLVIDLMHEKLQLQFAHRHMDSHQSLALSLCARLSARDVAKLGMLEPSDVQALLSCENAQDVLYAALEEGDEAQWFADSMDLIKRYDAFELYTTVGYEPVITALRLIDSKGWANELDGGAKAEMVARWVDLVADKATFDAACRYLANFDRMGDEATASAGVERLVGLSDEEFMGLKQLPEKAQKSALSLSGADFAFMVRQLSGGANAIARQFTLIHKQGGLDKARELGLEEAHRRARLLAQYQAVKADWDRGVALNIRTNGAAGVMLPTGPSELAAMTAEIALPDTMDFDSNFDGFLEKLERAKQAIAEVVASRPIDGSSSIPLMGRAAPVDIYYREMRAKYADRIEAIQAAAVAPVPEAVAPGV